MADSASDQVPEIPGYRIRHELGQGGMASVYLAIQESLEREVALKVLSTELVSDPDFCRRFLKEGRTLAQVTHPNVVTIFDSGEHQGIYYMCMELIRGGTLEDCIARGGLTLDKTLQVLKQVATALAWSHNKSLVHRDIKPGNVLFRDDDTAVLSDFGIAKNITQNATRMTAVGQAIGTPAYMSPEQASGKQLTARSDQYSLGVMLYEMLTGSVPFDADTSISVVVQHLQSPVPALPREYQHLQPIVERMMAKDPEERFNTLEEMLSALDNSSPGQAAMPRTEIIDSQPERPQGRRPAALMAAGMGIGAILLAGGAYLANQQGYFSGAEPEQVVEAKETETGTAASNLTPAERQEVEKWLDIAQTHYDIGRLVAPPGNNALEAYRKVLEVDPSNADAKQGVREIASTYEEAARESLQNGNTTQSRELLEEGLEAFPEHEGLTQLREQLAKR